VHFLVAIDHGKEDVNLPASKSFFGRKTIVVDGLRKDRVVGINGTRVKSAALNIFSARTLIVTGQSQQDEVVFVLKRG